MDYARRGCDDCNVLFVSIPLIDDRSKENRPGYDEHMKKVSAIIPWFRQKDNAGKRIVIAGLGDAGLLSAIQLNKKFEVIGISKTLSSSGQELGPRLARPKDWEENYLIDYDRFKGLKGVDIRHAKVSEIIADENKIGLIGYDGSERRSLMTFW